MSIKLKTTTLLMLLLTLTHVERAFSLDTELTNTLREYFDAYDKRRWDISGEGLYLKPNNITSSGVLSSKPYEFPTTYNLGYELHATYQTKSGQYLWIRWQHFNDEISNLNKTVDDIDNEGPTNVNYGYRSGFDMLSLEGGKTLYLKSLLALSFHGGLIYADMRLDNQYNYITNTSLSSFNQQVGSHYKGAGGAIGIDVIYAVTKSVELYVNSDFKLISRGGSITTHVNDIDRKVAPVVQTITDYDTRLTGVLTGADFVAGGVYHITRLDIRAGWMATLFDEASLQWSGAFLGVRWVSPD